MGTMRRRAYLPGPTPSGRTSAATRAALRTRPHMNTLEIKGDWNITKGKIHRWQVTVKVGFALEAAP